LCVHPLQNFASFFRMRTVRSSQACTQMDAQFWTRDIQDLKGLYCDIKEG
jgi:hypothetical protein